LEFGWKKSIGFCVLFAIGSDVTRQRFHGYSSSPSSSGARRSVLTTTCGPEAIERLFTSERSVAFEISSTSLKRSGRRFRRGARDLLEGRNEVRVPLARARRELHLDDVAADEPSLHHVVAQLVGDCF
jgi:hypothetical protein